MFVSSSCFRTVVTGCSDRLPQSYPSFRRRCMLSILHMDRSIHPYINAHNFLINYIYVFVCTCFHTSITYNCNTCKWGTDPRVFLSLFLLERRIGRAKRKWCWRNSIYYVLLRSTCLWIRRYVCITGEEGPWIHDMRCYCVCSSRVCGWRVCILRDWLYVFDMNAVSCVYAESGVCVVNAVSSAITSIWLYREEMEKPFIPNWYFLRIFLFLFLYIWCVCMYTYIWIWMGGWIVSFSVTLCGVDETRFVEWRRRSETVCFTLLLLPLRLLLTQYCWRLATSSLPLLSFYSNLWNTSSLLFDLICYCKPS